MSRKLRRFHTMAVWIFLGLFFVAVLVFGRG